MFSLLGIIAGLTIVPGLIAGYIFYNFTLRRKSKRLDFSANTDIFPEKAEKQEVLPQNTDEYDIKYKWLYDDSVIKRTKKLKLTSFDGLSLTGFYIENPEHKNRLVIMAHGYGMKHTMFHFSGKCFYDMGYSVLMPDMRGHGESGGAYIGMGWHDRLDLIQWARLFTDSQPGIKIVLYGVSMGASAVMAAAGESLPPQIFAAVADCGYSSLYKQLKHMMLKLFGLIPFPMIYFLDFYCKILHKWSIYDLSCVKQLEKCDIPMLFIHGSDDHFIPYLMLDEVYGAHRGKKRRLTIEGASHAESYFKNPIMYWDAVEEFLRNCEQEFS